MDPQNNEDYYRSEISSGAHGEEYQRDVALLMLERATREKCDFKLAYEMSDAGKFEDVAFYDETVKEWVLIQVKHSDTVKGPPKPIDWASLFPEEEKERKNSDFSLFKYLRSYLEVQNHFSGSKKVYIFTNRTLNTAIQEKFQNYDAHRMLRISNCEAKHVQLKSTDDIVNELHGYINQVFETLVNAIVELFNHGCVHSILNVYKTPLSNVLVLRNCILKFHENFSSNASDPNCRCLYDALQAKQIIGKEQHNISKDIKEQFNRKSRIKTLPPFIEKNQVEDFLRNLVLSVGQPDNLRGIIEREMRIWVKTWMQPDGYSRLTEAQVSISVTKLNDLFCDYNQKQMKKYLKIVDGERFFGIIENELMQQLRNPSCQRWKDFNRNYISRRIVYTEQNRVVRATGKSYKCTDYRIETQPLLKEAQINITDREFANQMMDKFADQQCLVFIAEPGMGKTTLLQYISFQVQQKDNCHVFLVYLNHMQKYLKEVKDVSDLDKALNVLRGAISESNRNIIKNVAVHNNYGVSSDRIVIFCDGFDEVHPNQAVRMIQVLKRLMAVKSLQIIISGRKHVRELLEKSFAIKSMRIAPLRFIDQVELFMKLGNVNTNEATSLVTSLASSFVRHYKVINLSQRDSTGSPLMIKMLSDVYSEQFQRILNPDCGEDVNSPILSKTLDIVDLFEKFVKKCFQDKMSKKFNSEIDDDSSDDEYDFLRDSFVKEHQSLAVNQFQILETQDCSKQYKAFRARIDKGSEKSMLVEKVDGKIQFTHLSYAEYFVAKLLYERIVEYSSEISGIFEQNPGIRIFFFTMVEKWQATKSSEHFKILNVKAQTDYLLAFYACEANCINLVKLLSIDHDLESLKHKKMGSMLHVAAENDCTEVFRFLIAECGSDYLNENGGSLLFIASGLGNRDIVELLISKGVAVNQINLHHVTTISDKIDNIAQKEDKWAPLHIASLYGHERVCQLLINSDASIDIQTQSDGLTPLYFAAQNGHVDVAKLLIDKGAFVDHQGLNNNTPLLIAATIGHADIVALLITEGASVDMQDTFGWTSIHFAAQNNHIDILELLIAHNAKVDVKAENGVTPLYMAAQNGHADAAKLLIDKNTSVDAQETNKWTPLHIAVQNGLVDMVKLLIDKNASVDIKNDDGNIPLHVAAIKGHSNVAFLLINSAPSTIDSKNDDGHTPLHMAADIGFLDIAELLIKHGASLDIKDNNEWTPLNFAVQKNQTKLAQLLLDYKATVDVNNKNGATPLHIAAIHGHLEVAKVLIEHHKPLVNIRNRVGATPLHVAVLNGHTLVAKLLINQGALVEVEGPHERTPLFLAAMFGNPELVEVLIDHGAETNIKDKDKLTPLYIAAENGFTRIAELLISEGAIVDIQNLNGWTPLQIASKNNRTDIVELLINSGAQVNKRNNDELSALHIAAAAGHINVVKRLLKCNALIHIRDKEGCTPLYYAVQEGHVEIVKLLVKSGAKVNTRRKDGITLLYTAAQDGHVDIAKYLIEQGSLDNTQYTNVSTPLHIAVQNGHIDMVNLLIESGTMIETRTEAGLTPLQIAAYKGHANIALLLINKGALVDSQEPSGWTPLHMAAQEGHVDVVHHLLNSDARVDIMQKKRNTPLYVAAANGKTEIVKLLITSGAAVNVKDKDGTAPLYIAAQNGHVDVAKCLIEQGAKVNIQDKIEWTPLHIAAQNGHDEIVKLLITSGATLDIKDKNGATAFFIAIRHGNLSIAKLLNKGQDISSADIIMSAVFKFIDKNLTVQTKYALPT